MNKFRWKQKWSNMWAHQRVTVIKLLGYKDNESIIILVNAKYDSLHYSIQVAMKHLNRDQLILK